MLDDDDIPNAHDVFISYAHLDGEHDAANAARLGEWLDKEGFDVWWDRHLMSGDWQRQLVQKAASRRVIVLWSPAAEVSKYVHAECAIAAANESLSSLIIEDDPKHPVPKEWTHFQYLKLTDFEKQKPRILAMLPPPSRGKIPVREAMADARVSIAALPTASGELIGRDNELAMLRQAWASTASGADPAQKTNVVVLHAIGGAGKTALTRHFVDGLADRISRALTRSSAGPPIPRARATTRPPMPTRSSPARSAFSATTSRVIPFRTRWSAGASSPISSASAAASHPRRAGAAARPASCQWRPPEGKNWRRITRASSSSPRGRNCPNSR